MLGGDFDICKQPILHEDAYGNAAVVSSLLRQSPTFRNVAVPSVREAYVQMVEAAIAMPVDPEKHEKLRAKLAMLNWMNPICKCCRAKAPGTYYYPCERCYLYLYCSPECRDKDRASHQLYCGDRGAPADPDDPTTPVVMKTKGN